MSKLSNPEFIRKFNKELAKLCKVIPDGVDVRVVAIDIEAQHAAAIEMIKDNYDQDMFKAGMCTKPHLFNEVLKGDGVGGDQASMEMIVKMINAGDVRVRYVALCDITASEWDGNFITEADQHTIFQSKRRFQLHTKTSLWI